MIIFSDKDSLGYTLLYTKLYVLLLKICFVKKKKIVQYIIRSMYLFCPKISKNHSLKIFWAAYYML